MSNTSDVPLPRVEVITSVQRRRRWSAAEKVRLVEETMQPGSSVSFVARRTGISPSFLFRWKRRMRSKNKPAVNAKRVLGLMQQHGLTLERHTARRSGRTHDGAVIALRSNVRWCSDHLELQARTVGSFMVQPSKDDLRRSIGLLRRERDDAHSEIEQLEEQLSIIKRRLAVATRLLGTHAIDAAIAKS